MAGVAVLAVSVLWLVLTDNTDIRYSGDHEGTVPVWQRWVPLLVGVLLVRLVPPAVSDPGLGVRGPGQPGLRLVVGVLVTAAVVFAVALRAAGGGEPAHTLLKALLLLAVPLVLFAVLRRRKTPWRPPAPARVRRLAPAVPVGAWLVLAYASPLALPTSDDGLNLDLVTLVGIVVVGFAANAVLEEVFYRRWLQSSVEGLLGRWAGIVAAALLFGIWHVGIQGTARLDVDLASAVVNQGILGVFLGYLWSRYRRMWPPLVVHGALNAAPLVISML